jgi:hypothetical protein
MEDLFVKQLKLQLIVLVLAAVGLAQQSQSSAAGPLVPSYPDSTDGLERMMGDMISLQRGGQSVALAPYLQSLVLPQPEAWFTSKFGNVRCGEGQLAANDCLGPRLVLTYAATAQTLPPSR